MPYQRPDARKDSYHQHPIRTHDIHKHLHINAVPYFLDIKDLLDEGNFAIGQLQRTLVQIKTSDWSEYKRQSAQAKQNELIHSARTAMLTFLKKHIERSKDYLNRTRDQITGLSEPQLPSDPIKAQQEIAMRREIRDILRASEPAIRHALIQKGGLPWLQAAIEAPDSLADGKFIEKQRRNYAFMIDPSLQQKEEDAVAEYQAVRRTCADISAIASHLLIDNKYDPEESLPPQEFYDVFPPESDYEANLIRTRIENYQKKVYAEALKKKFELEQAEEKEAQTATGLKLEEAPRAE